MRSRAAILAALLALLASSGGAQTRNLRVVTDASPDFHDIEGFVRYEPFDSRIALPKRVRP